MSSTHTCVERLSESEAQIGFPCSQSQKRFWFETQLDPHNPALNVAVRWRLEGKVVHAKLEEAWRRIIARHQTLRTAFVTTGGEPRQVIAPNVAFRIPIVDLTALPAEAADAEAERLAALEAKRTFDIAKAPLIRVTHVRLRSDVSVILVTAHHAACDGWSVGILAAEMGEICAALDAGRNPVLPEIAVTYADYAAREREALASADSETHRDEIARRWQGFKQFEILPDKPRPPVQTPNGEIVSALLERDLTDALGDLARKKRCTLFMVAYAGLLALLHRYSGDTDITIGTQIAGRDDVEFERLVGTFVNTMALRTDVAGDPTVDELLERARDTVSDAFELRDVPLEELIEIVNPKRDLSRNPLFSINFVLQRSFIKNETYGSFKLIDLPSRSAGPICDLNFFMVERPEGWRASCEFNTDLYRRETVDRLLQRWIMMLRAVAHDPSSRVSELPLLTETETAQLASWVGRSAHSPPDRTVVDAIEEQALRTPEAIAVVFGDARLTYRDLNARANALAQYLQSTLSVNAEDRIGILLDRSEQLVIAILAILKTGAAYVPVDPGYPRERIDFMLDDGEVRAVLTDAKHRSAVPSDISALTLPFDGAPMAGNPARVADPEHLAYVIYTSGSTGRPKGCAITHASLLFYLSWADSYYFESPEHGNFALFSPVSFDLTITSLFLPLMRGRTLTVLGQQLQPAEMLAQVFGAQLGVDCVKLTPSHCALLDMLDLRATSVRLAIVGGEAFTAEQAHALWRLNPEMRIVNEYGPTEATVGCIVHDAVPTEAHIPIGRPIAGSTVALLDSHGQMTPIGIAGEIFVGGPGLARGYHRRPQLDAERFVEGPGGERMYRTGDYGRWLPNGDIEYLGRKDDQVKIRGFRIELPEIEAVLSRHPSVRDAAVVVGTEFAGDKAIWAYVVPRGMDPGDFDVDELRAWLKERLPAFMLPSAIAALTEFPLSTNGKVDRQALPPPEPSANAADYHGPTEERLGGILADLLGTRHVDPDADLFALGLHSLLAVRFTSRVKEMSGFELPLRVLFENPTVAALAAYMDDTPISAEQRRASPIVTLNASGSRTPFIFFHSDLFADGLYARKLAAALGPDQPVHSVAPHGTAGLPLLPTIESMARDYAGLIRSVQPSGPYRLGGYCGGGLVAYEVARLLSSGGDVVDRLVLLNSSPMPARRIGLFDALIRRCGLDHRLAPALRDRLCYNLARLHAAVLMGPMVTLNFAFKIARLPFSARSQAPASGHEPKPFEKRRGLRETENSFAHLVAAFTYHPKPYDGSATLIWADEQETTFDDPTHGWGTALQVNIESIGGGHVEAVYERTDDLARLLKTVLGDQRR